MHRAASTFQTQLRRAGRAEGGGVAIMFSLLLMPLTLLSFGAVEVTQAMQVRSQLQNALDAASLAIARSGLRDAAAVDALGLTVLRANLGDKAGDQTLVSDFTRLTDGTVQGDASLVLEGVLVYDELTVATHSEATGMGRKLEVVLVLDNTHSMVRNAQNAVVTDAQATKLHQLKLGATAFVDILGEAAANQEPGALKISVVPFSNTVNVGTAHRSLMDTGALSPQHRENFSAAVNRFTLLQNMGVAWGGCVESRKTPYDILETAPTTGTRATLFVPYFAPDEPDNVANTNNYRPDGSTGSFATRQQNASKYNAAPTRSGKYSLYAEYSGYEQDLNYRYGPNFGCALRQLTRLTTDTSAVKTTISAMNAVGDTNIPLGLMWGWHTLSPNTPFGDGVAYNDPEVDKIVVLMTDGQNQVLDSLNSNTSYYGGIGYSGQNRMATMGSTDSQRRTALDGRLTALCNNIKARNITIYTVRVEVTQGSNAVLQGCATDTTKFHDVQQASQLTTVFQDIAGQITRLRLTD